MNLRKLLDAVLALGSNISIKEGKEIHKLKLVTGMTSKSIDGVYHIYSKVKEEDYSKSYSCHIKYNLKNEKVNGATCTCSTYEEFSKHKNNYVCKHIIASIFSFYIIAKNKIKKSNRSNNTIQNKINRSDNYKKEIKLDLDIKSIKEKNIFMFDVQFRIGEGSTYLVTKLNEFFQAMENKSPLRINGEFLFNPYNMYFSESDKELLSFAIDRFKENDEVKIIEGKYLRLKSNEIRDFLSLVSSDKKVKFNYDYINYETFVYKENLPLSFTLKLENDSVNLTTKKKLPIPLSNKFDVFLYDRKIYLPSISVANSYFGFWKELKRQGKIEYSKESNELIKVIKVLSEISSDVILSEGIKRICRRFWKPKLSFSTENKLVKCKAIINYFGKNINILENDSIEFFRDLTLEDEIDRRLERLRFIKKNKDYIFIGNDDEYYEFLTAGINELALISKVTFNKSFEKSNLLNSKNIEAIIEDEEDNLYFKFNIEDIDFSEYKDILEALKDGRKYYKSKKSRLINLKDIGMKNFLNMLDNLSYRKDLSQGILEVDKNKALFLENSIEGNNLSFIRGNKIVKDIADKLSNRNETEISQVKGFNGQLRNYQLVGVNYLKALSNLGFGGILADEMGLGKTIQIISFLLEEKNLKEDNKKSLIVAPTSLLYNWKAEFEKFAPQIKVGIVHGNKNVREKILMNINEFDVLITTYGTIKNDIDFYENEVFDYCIIDEAQNIKNPKAQNTKVIKEINAKVKFALTGTPIENTIVELWSIFDFIMPGYLFDESSFKEKFMHRDEDELEELKILINPFILRRLKRDVISELPEKIEKKYYVQMTSDQRLAYKNYMKDVKLSIKNGEEDKVTIFSYLTRLRQICLDPSLVDENYNGKNGKINTAIDIIEDIIESKYKILVFSQFTSVLKKLRKELIERGIESKYLDGTTVAKERISLVNEFNESKEAQVFLISLKAGGTGLNLTSAKFVMHMDPWWNPAIEDQATDRAHRIGQKNIVEVIKLIAKDTIEENIIKLQEDKREIINSVISDDSLNINNISKLTNEEILDLFK